MPSAAAVFKSQCTPEEKGNPLKKEALFEKKEAMRYVFWGIVTTIFNYVSYFLLQMMMSYQIANLISIVATKTLAYCTNRTFVFRHHRTAVAPYCDAVLHIG